MIDFFTEAFAFSGDYIAGLSLHFAMKHFSARSLLRPLGQCSYRRFISTKIAIWLHKIQIFAQRIPWKILAVSTPRCRWSVFAAFLFTFSIRHQLLDLYFARWEIWCRDMLDIFARQHINRMMDMRFPDITFRASAPATLWASANWGPQCEFHFSLSMRHAHKLRSVPGRSRKRTTTIQ